MKIRPPEDPPGETAKCRLLHVVKGFEMGGVTRFVEWMVSLNGTVASHHDVLVGQTIPDHLVPRLIRENARLHQVDPSRGALLRSVGAMRRLSRDYDAFLIHTAYPAVVLPLILSRKACLLFQHGMSPAYGSAVRKRLMQWWLRMLPRLLNAKVVCSTRAGYEKALSSGLKFKESDIVIVPFGIPLTAVRTARTGLARTGKLTVGMAGRLVRQKRHELVLRSLADYHGNTPIEILIAGDGLLRTELEEIATSVRPNVNVEFLGEIEDMRRFYDQIDLLLFPSRRESFGFVVPEAFDRCVPVAVFRDVGGCFSLVEDGKNGFVLEDGLEGLSAFWSILESDASILPEMSRTLAATDWSNLDVRKTREHLDRIAGCKDADTPQ